MITPLSGEIIITSAIFFTRRAPRPADYADDEIILRRIMRALPPGPFRHYALSFSRGCDIARWRPMLARFFLSRKVLRSRFILPTGRDIRTPNIASRRDTLRRRPVSAREGLTADVDAE